MKHLSKWIIHSHGVPLNAKDVKLLFTAINLEGFKLGLEPDLSKAVDLEKRLLRMYQIKKDEYSH